MTLIAAESEDEQELSGRRDDPSPSNFVLGPFCFTSDLPLVELRLGGASGLISVRVTLAEVSVELPGAKRLDEFCQVAATKYMLDIPGVARYLVEDGCKVSVEVAPDAPARDVRGYLLGSIFGALCHQNGFLPLHASAVQGAGGATAFLGNSGAGKSTTAAFLERRGYTVVADDICLMQRGPDGLRVLPVAGWLKLWQETYDQLGEAPAAETRIYSDLEKYRRYLEPETGTKLTLRHVVFLERTDGPPALERMSAGAAIAALMDHTYLGYVVDLMGTQAELFRWASDVLGEARPWRLRIPRAWDALPQALDVLEERLLQG